VTGGGGRYLHSEPEDADHSVVCLFVRTVHAVELKIWEPRLGVRAAAADGRDSLVPNSLSLGELQPTPRGLRG